MICWQSYNITLLVSTLTSTVCAAAAIQSGLQYTTSIELILFGSAMHRACKITGVHVCTILLCLPCLQQRLVGIASCNKTNAYHSEQLLYINLVHSSIRCFSNSNLGEQVSGFEGLCILLEVDKNSCSFTQLNS